MGIATAIVAGAAIVGATASAFGKKNPQFNFDMGEQSALGKQGEQAAGAGLSAYNSSLNGGAFSQGQQAQSDYASLLQAYSQPGSNVPTGADVTEANKLADTLFKTRQVSLNQAFQDQLVAANRQAAISGRTGNDPILRAKLAQEQTRQQDQLAAQQQSFAAQQAMSQPGQRLAYSGERANVLATRGSQDLAANQGYAQLGSAFQQTDYNQRFQAANTMATGKFNQDSQEKSFGERLGSSINGSIASYGALMGMGGGASGMFGGGGGSGGYNPFASSGVSGGGAQNFGLGANTNFGNSYGKGFANG